MHIMTLDRLGEKKMIFDHFRLTIEQFLDTPTAMYV